MRILIGGFALTLAVLASGCIVVPVDPPHRYYGPGYYGPGYYGRGDSVTFSYDDDDRRGHRDHRDWHDRDR